MPVFDFGHSVKKAENIICNDEPNPPVPALLVLAGVGFNVKRKLVILLGIYKNLITALFVEGNGKIYVGFFGKEV